MRRMILTTVGAMILGMLLADSSWAQDGYCVVRVSGLNQNRKVFGNISAECGGDPPWPHSAPFGNWGVASNFGDKEDGNQFQGWCKDNYCALDNLGKCATHCTDRKGWYEWNSCTTDVQWAPRNCDLYNADDCSTQITTKGLNVHGTSSIRYPVACPMDTDDDGYCDTGGCLEMPSYSSGGNHMTMYELDPVDEDELIQTLYFDSFSVPLTCTARRCGQAVPVDENSERIWATPSSHDSPTSPAKVYAELSITVEDAVFLDSGECATLGQTNPVYDCN